MKIKMGDSKKSHYDFMKLVITGQKSVRAPQVNFPPQKNLAIKNPDRQASRTALYKLFQNTCVCDNESGPTDTFGSFSDGFDDGFDI